MVQKTCRFLLHEKTFTDIVFQNLRDAYKIPRFHVRSKIAQCDPDQGSFVFTLSVRN